MTKAQINHMVGRFLSWKLPENFHPDAGISFVAAFNEHTAHPMRHEPSGTNLFDAVQAEAMVRHMVEGLPSDHSGDANEMVLAYVEAGRLAVEETRAEQEHQRLEDSEAPILECDLAHVYRQDASQARRKACAAIIEKEKGDAAV